ncbi:TetR/AcrR family transcriptional regulator [Nocardia bovistercoris]|uniref:TetR/AcrR family transcriptional regulator n=1 Tax=Nocardia bovistercoris TaxID=2785916 RepID=A0A931N3J3_9NOCA|nr:TetR/AcrR family transcriptional regulator [Nocardia bovistercoris]MBH0780695.1 TetR/AcrR family transcriptional regulator [Nocardia bovistercoris]
MGSTPHRSDARRNREHLLDVAREALAADAATSMNAIAKRAGVGPGTLYRHFPSREALIMELYRTELTALIDLVPRLLDEHRPLDALRAWFDEIRRYAGLKYGLAGVIHAATDNDRPDPAYALFVAAIALLLEAGARSGDLKPDIDPEDVLLQLSVLWRVDPAVDPGRADRLVNLIIDGLLAKP